MQHPVVFQTLQGVNRREMLESYLPTLQKHKDVILLDRWTPSTWVYGSISGVTAEQTEVILDGVPNPDLTIILDGEPFAMDKEADSYEADGKFQADVRAGYQEWAAKHGTTLINANRGKDEVASEILAVVLEFLNG